jgi:hypothetical protein
MKFTYTPQEYKLLPAGEVKLTVTNAYETLSKKGKDCIKLELSHPDITGVIYDYLSPEFASRFHEFLRALGVGVNPNETIDIDPQAFIGKDIRAIIFIDEYNGRQSNKVEKYLPANNQESSGPF